MESGALWYDDINKAIYLAHEATPQLTPEEGRALETPMRHLSLQDTNERHH
jgi:hypothetical protein